jgi:hypothetical protein
MAEENVTTGHVRMAGRLEGLQKLLTVDGMPSRAVVQGSQACPDGID